ncbi:MAG: periplasmic heavy metal sensor, partial [Myxococcota bacterium]
MRWLLCTLFLPVAASADPGRPPPPPPGPPPLVHVVERHGTELGIDEATQSRIAALAQSERSTHEALRDDVKAAHDALRAAMEVDVPDGASVLAASEQLGLAETALRNHRLEVDLSVIAELGPEGWATLRAHRPEPPRRRR